MSIKAITLICSSTQPVLSNEFAGAFSCWLDHNDCGPVRRDILADGAANDFLVDTAWELGDLRSKIVEFVADEPVDIIVQPAANRRKRLLIADMDSTIIGQECIDELADFAGLKAEISAITERAMRGALDFEAALTERVGMLKGLPESVLEEAFRTRITLNPGARTLALTMNRLGATTVLVSGGFTYFVERIARLAGFQHYQANELLIENGALSGKVKTPILGREAKEAALRQFADKNSIPLAETLAVGDGANDLDMINAAGLGVAYRAKPKVAAAADASILHGDLTALLYAQGIAQEDFA